MKRFTVKVFDKAGTTFKGVLNQQEKYGFQEVVNAGQGEMTMRIPFDIYEEVGLVNTDLIEIWVQDKDTTGTRIYSGYVYKIIKSYTDTPIVTISILGYGSRFGFVPDMSSTTTISVERLSMTITNAITDVIDKFKTTIGDSLVNYGSGTIETNATTLSYTANCKSTLEVIERYREMMGGDWFWTVDGDRVFRFGTYANQTLHTLIMGKDVYSLEVEESIDDITNLFILWNGLQVDDDRLLAYGYYNGASQTAYWLRFKKQTDGRLTDSTSMNALGTAFITANKNPNKLIKLKIKDNNYGEGYDIESIKVGHRLQILNNDNPDLYNGTLLVTGITYTPEYLTVMVADERSLTSRELSKIRKELDQTVYEDVVPTITLSSV